MMAPRKPTAKPAARASSQKTAPNPIKQRKAKATKQCKQIFAGMSFSFAGNFGDNWSYEKMSGWVRAHGGEHESVVSEDTTHLVCTIEEYKKRTKQGSFIRLGYLFSRIFLYKKIQFADPVLFCSERSMEAWPQM